MTIRPDRSAEDIIEAIRTSLGKSNSSIRGLLHPYDVDRQGTGEDLDRVHYNYTLSTCSINYTYSPFYCTSDQTRSCFGLRKDQRLLESQ